MSFCCGASMIGTRGTLKYYRTQIRNVPLLFCPVCHRTQVHYLVENEYDILAEYAHADGALEVDFTDYVDAGDNSRLYENCVNSEHDEPFDVVRTQIDLALDLLTIARDIRDEEWQEQLKKRLKVLSDRKAKIEKRNKKIMG